MGESPFLSLKYPCLMGIVNVTPDSFSDGGRFMEAGAAVERGLGLVRAGAGVLDVGAEATSFFRAGVEAVGAGEQLRRLGPVLGGWRGLPGEIVISVDTRSAAVAEGVLRRAGREWGGAGVGRGWVINDVSGGLHEPELLDVVARPPEPGLSVGVILMHMGAGYPKTPERDDGDIVGRVKRELMERKAAAMAAGIREECIALDPGVGFGKTMGDNWRLALADWSGMGVMVLGVSRKRFLETEMPGDLEVPAGWEGLVGRLRGEKVEHVRDGMTATITAVAGRRWGGIHRVHDVGLAVKALGM